MKIGWRAITTLQHFLCERQNTLVKKRKDASFKIKKNKYDDLLKEVNESMFLNNPIGADSFRSLLDIFRKDGTIIQVRNNKDRFMVSEKIYGLSDIKMIKVKRESTGKKPKERQKMTEFKKDLKEGEIQEEKVPPQPIRETMSEQEKIKRVNSIAQFEKGILLYYKRHYQEAIIEFQKVIDNFNVVIDVTAKAKQYMKFCKDDSRKIKAKEKKKIEPQVSEEQKEEIKYPETTE